MKDYKKTTDRGNGKISRRDFIAGAGAAAMSFAVMKPELVHGTETNSKSKLGMIGCGMRGNWIADLFVKHGGYEIVGAVDYFQDRVDEFGEKFGVDKAHRYATLSGYKRLLEQDLDAVAIESPPYFHPEQAAAAVDAGVHAIVAKPVAVDVPGCNLIAESGKKAASKNLVFYVDFQTRTNAFYREAVKRVQYGDIGHIVCGEASFKCGDVWNTWNDVAHFLKDNPNDPEARLKAWGMDKKLSGSIVVEQSIHAIDVATWILDDDAISAYGTGGRKHYKYGDIWDYFAVIYHFPKDVVVNFMAKQCDGGDFGAIGCRMYGLNGAIDTDYSGEVTIRGNNPYKGGSTGNLYPDGTSANIAIFYDNITKGRFANTTVAPSVRSNLASILGREAAYNRREVTWDQMLKANEKLESDVIKGLKA
jgi:predicted dehydrogenase